MAEAEQSRGFTVKCPPFTGKKPDYSIWYLNLKSAILSQNDGYYYFFHPSNSKKPTNYNTLNIRLYHYIFQGLPTSLGIRLNLSEAGTLGSGEAALQWLHAEFSETADDIVDLQTKLTTLTLKRSPGAWQQYQDDITLLTEKLRALKYPYNEDLLISHFKKTVLMPSFPITTGKLETAQKSTSPFRTLRDAMEAYKKDAEITQWELSNAPLSLQVNAVDTINTETSKPPPIPPQKDCFNLNKDPCDYCNNSKHTMNTCYKLKKSSNEAKQYTADKLSFQRSDSSSRGRTNDYNTQANNTTTKPPDGTFNPNQLYTYNY